jgi:DNA-binding NtrC family response regulator
MIKGNILIVDDNNAVLESLEYLLQFEFSNIYTINKPTLIFEKIAKHSIDLILLDMNFVSTIYSGNEGFYWLKQIQEKFPKVKIILITAYGDVEQAVRAMKEGATDFIVKPWDNNKLIATIKAGLKAKNKITKPSNNNKFPIETNIVIGKSDKMQNIASTIEKIAKTDANVLLTGENGTGKSMFADYIHNLSNRNNNKIIKVDIASFSENLLESELFGHCKGAYTGAHKERIGRFEEASGSTIFLDEIGNLPLTAQTKILSAIQERKIIKLGNNSPSDIDIRLISATNKNLTEMIRANQFREDLYYRINTIVIDIPPLRERVEDIDVLADFFLKTYTLKYGKPWLSFGSKSFDKLKKYNWPGNVRELNHVVEKAVILCDNDVILPNDFIFNSKRDETTKKVEFLSLEEHEKHLIEEAIFINNGNLKKTAQQLKIARQTLYRKIKKYNIE